MRPFLLLLVLTTTAVTNTTDTTTTTSITTSTIINTKAVTNATETKTTATNTTTTNTTPPPQTTTTTTTKPTLTTTTTTAKPTLTTTTATTKPTLTTTTTVLTTAKSTLPRRVFPGLPDVYTTNIEVKTHWQDRFFVYIAKEHRIKEKHAYYFETFHPATLNQTTTALPPITSSNSTYRRGRSRHPKQMAVYFDFAINLARVIDFTGGRKICRHTYNSTRHVRDASMVSRHPGLTTSQLFGDTLTNNYTYMGIANVRNLECHHWKRHIQNETIDYYFLETESESESKGETKMTMRLVRVVESNVGYGRDSVFDYFGFRTNKIPSMEEMQPPLGTFCSHTNMSKPLPTIPRQMTFSVEYRPESLGANWTNHWFVAHYKIFWDRDNKITRADHHIQENGKEWKPVTDISDDARGFRYESFTTTKCHVLEKDYYAVSVTPYFKNKRHWVRARDAFEHLERYKADFVYEGEHMVRGVPTDVWIYKSESLGQNGFNEIEWYFTKPTVTEISSLGNNPEMRIPVRIVGYLGNRTEEFFEMDLFDFRNETFASDFETPMRNCLQVTGRLHTVQLFVLDLPSNDIEFTSNLKETMVKKFKDLTKEKDSGRFMIEMLASTDHLNVLVNILPLRIDEDKGQISKIATAIEDAISNQDVTFQFKVNNTMHTATFARSYVDLRKLTCYSDQLRNDESQKTLATVLAFMVVLFFVFGALLSFIVVKCILKRNGHNLNEMMRRKQIFVNEPSLRQITESADGKEDDISNIMNNGNPTMSDAENPRAHELEAKM